MKIVKPFIRIATISLLSGVSLFGLTTTAEAARVLFSTDSDLTGKQLKSERPISIKSGTTQVMFDNGAIAAFVNAAQFIIHNNGSLDLMAGTVTVVTPDGASAAVNLPANISGTVSGANASASFTVDDKGTRGSVISGSVSIFAEGVARSFAVGNFWSAMPGHSVEQVVANAAAAVPEQSQVRSVRDGGISAAAQNGVPVALGEALAAVGVNGDILNAAHHIDAYDRNPTLATFPSGDYAALTAYAAQAANPFGGVAFSGAGADVITTYFQYLARGGVGDAFLTNYSKTLMSYLDLLRSGALPSGFTGASQDQLNAYLAFIGRTSGFGSLTAANQSLISAYTSFLSTGGNANNFAGSINTLISTYLDYVRTGADPAAFTLASQSIVAQYLAILQSSGFSTLLTAQNQALLTALANNGNTINFANSEATALAAFVKYLNGGGLPSAYTAIDAATLRSYLEALNATGLFNSLLGTQATFLSGYLAYLQGGGVPDQYAGLPNPTPTPPPAPSGSASAPTGSGLTYAVTNGNKPTVVGGATLSALPTGQLSLIDGVDRGTTTDNESGGVDGVLGWTRWSGGTTGSLFVGANSGISYVWGTPVTARPASGIATYALAGNTAPIALSGKYTPGTVNSAHLAVDFGSSKVGYDASLAIGGNTFDFASTGGVAAPSIVLANDQFSDGVTLNGGGFAFVSGFLAGPAAGYAGLSYAVTLTPFLGAESINGVLAFKQAGAPTPPPPPTPAPTPTPSSGGTTPTGSGAGALATATGVVFDNITSSVFNNAPQIATSGAVTPTLSLNSLGELQSATVFNSTTGRGTAISTDVFANGTVGIGRWTGGTLTDGTVLLNNQSYNYAVALPVAALPTSGSATYNLLSATAPTFVNGISGQGTVTSATLAVAFGSAPTIAFQAALTMPEASGTVGYTLSSIGGLANPATSDIFFFPANTPNPTGGFEGSLTVTPGSTTNVACNGAASCGGFISGALAGSDVSGAVVAYNAGTDSAKSIIGTIALGKGGTPPPPPPPPPSPPPATTLFPGYSDVTQLNASGRVANFQSNKNIVQLDGTVDSLGSFGGTISRNTATAANAGFAKAANGDIFAWSRWTNGTVIEPSGPNEVLSAKQGDYILVGKIATNAPTSGIVHFSLLGATAPTFTDGSADPGTFSGNLTVNFATNRLGLDFLIGLDGQVYTLRTPGDPQNPLDLNSGASISGIGSQLAVTGGLCSPVCNGRVDGLLFGNGATQAGVNYLIGTGAKQIIGSAAFGSGTQTVTQANPVPAPPPPAPSGLAPSGTNIPVVLARTDGSYINVYPVAQVTAASTGTLDSWITPAFNSNRAFTTDHENGGLAGVIGWSRWSGGNTTGAIADTYRADGGVAHIWGTPATNIPTSGVANYTYSGSTKPVVNNGSVTPGSVTGAALAVDFGTQKVGLEAIISIASNDVFVATAGGIGAPSLALAGNGTFAGSLTVNGGAVVGFLAGSGASYAGVAYTIPVPVIGNLPVSGVIAFTKH